MRRVHFLRDPHAWSAVAALAFGIALNHIRTEPWRTDLQITYSTLAAAGIIAARQQTDSRLTTRSKDDNV